MMKKLNFLLLSSLVTTVVLGQANKFWKDTKAETWPLEITEESTVFPEEKRAFELQFDQLSTQLATNAPSEFSGQSGFVIELPLPDGNERFNVYHSPVVEPELQEKYPDIRSYKGFGIEDPSKILRMTLSPLGLKASIRTSEGEIYIDPFIEGQKLAHAAYYVNDLDPVLLHEAMPACGNSDIMNDSPVEGLDFEHSGQKELGLRSAGDPINLRTFRVAIAATGEWTLAEGGKDNAVAKIVSCVDRGNQVFENEVGFRLILVGTNDVIVYANPETDPFPGSEPKAGRDLLGRNTTILNTRIGNGTYDIGHIFTNRCSDVGGVASLASVCGGNKGAGVTCWYNRNLDYTVVRIMCHEMGHQFSGPHTFNNCGGNESGATAYEPGSGSTIMSYGGLCGANNVVSGGPAARDITYYHANSVMRLFTFSRFVGCGSEITTNNTRPDANLNYQDGFYIPASTPFFIEGEGIDNENDNLTYCFEQHDFSARQCPLGDPSADCPMFRSFPPNADDYRVFPRFSTVWNNQIASSITEVLPDYSRELNFVLTVRDNNPEVGGFGMDTMTFNSTDIAGPFLVSYPNNGEDQIAGSYVEVKWDVANTDQAPVSCKFVDILLYNGSSWDNYEPLALSTANDGSEWVLMPETTGSNKKIMVRAADNIFFDISDRTFSIQESSTPGFSFGLSPNSARICLPEIFTADILASAFGGYNGTLELEIIDGLPAGATYSFGQTSIDASENTTLEIDLTDVTSDEDMLVQVQAISDQGDTLIREIALDIVRSDYSDLAASFPNDGLQGVEQSPSLEWPEIEDADFYNVQIATNPSFDPSTIIEEWSGLTNNSAKLNVLLDKNSIFYWRVQAGNVCGLSDFIKPAAFSTEAASCAVYEGPDKGVIIQSNTTKEFGVNIFQNADVNDVNVSHLDFFCDFLQDAHISLVSPSGTEVVLFDNRCGNTTIIDCAFDDDAPDDIKCPPINMRPYRPAGKLSDFNGEPSQGKWNLKVELNRFAASSRLTSWELELCSNTVLDAPILVTNDTMKTRPLVNNPVSSSLLFAEDNNNDADELVYTVTQAPSRGILFFNGNPVAVGMTFSQADINSAQVNYENVDGQEGLDGFSFTVNDGEGGWTGTHTFTIALDEDFPSSVNDLENRAFFKVFPNPNDGRFTVYLDQPASGPVDIIITDLKGRVVANDQLGNGGQLLSIDMNNLGDGVYMLRAIGNEAYFTERLIVTNR